MDSLPYVSIIIPTRNRAAYLGDTLASLLAQGYPAERYEVIVVDDGSTDDTAAVSQRHSVREGDPRIRYVRQEAGGANAARNTGIAIAEGDPVILIDDDIEAPADWLRAMVDGMNRHPDADCVGGPIHLRLEGRAPRFCGREPFGETELDLGDVDVPAEAVWSANMAIKKAALERVGPFNERLRVAGDEREWEERLQAAGGLIYYIADAWLWHRRVQEDLRFWKLLRVRFRRGVAQARFERTMGRGYGVVRQARAIVRSLAHAVRRWCFAGLLAAATQAGRVWDESGARLSRSTHSPSEE